MSDYINRKDAIKICSDANTLGMAILDLLQIKSADVAPVRHGKWEAFEDMMLDTCYRCSECGREFYLADCGTPQENEYNYCPNCGAKMDEVKNAE